MNTTKQKVLGVINSNTNDIQNEVAKAIINCGNFKEFWLEERNKEIHKHIKDCRKCLLVYEELEDISNRMFKHTLKMS